MRKFFTVAMVATAALGLAACSEQTQDNAAETADSMGNDVENAVDAAGEATDEMGNAVANEATAVEADVQDESMNEAAAD